MTAIPGKVLRHCGARAEVWFDPMSGGSYMSCPVCGLRTKGYYPTMAKPGTDWQMLSDMVVEWNELVMEQKLEEGRNDCKGNYTE